MLNFEKQKEEALQSMLVGLSARDAVLNYHQIHGLLFAMSCSPESIAPAEWFELIWLSDDPQFDDPAEAKTFYRLLLSLSQAIEADVQAARYRPGAARSGGVDAAALADWCDGFLMGHNYLEDVWMAALDDLDDDPLYEQVAGVVAWAMAFVDGDIVDHEVEDDDDRLLSELLQFQQLLEHYRGVRARLSESERWSVQRMFEEMEPVARDEACPCGSGRAFGQCCLH